MKKILTAEDDREINRLICEYLASQGYDTLSALNGLDAVRMVREQEDISLLILDLIHDRIPAADPFSFYY